MQKQPIADDVGVADLPDQLLSVRGAKRTVDVAVSGVREDLDGIGVHALQQHDAGRVLVERQPAHGGFFPWDLKKKE